MRIPYPSPTPLLTPLGIRCGGALLLPRAYRDIVSLYPVLSLLANSEYCLAICVRLCIVRVSVGVLGFGRTFFIIGGVDRSFLRLRGVWLWSIVGLPLTANGSAIWRMKCRGTNHIVHVQPIWYGLLPLYRKLYPAVASNRRRMTPY